MMGRLSTPEEFKGAGLFLLSKASSFMVRASYHLHVPRCVKTWFRVDLVDWLEPHHRWRPHCLVNGHRFLYALFSDSVSNTPSRGKRRRDMGLCVRSRFVSFRVRLSVVSGFALARVKLLHQFTTLTTICPPRILDFHPSKILSVSHLVPRLAPHPKAEKGVLRGWRCTACIGAESRFPPSFHLTLLIMPYNTGPNRICP